MTYQVQARDKRKRDLLGVLHLCPDLFCRKTFWHSPVLGVRVLKSLNKVSRQDHGLFCVLRESQSMRRYLDKCYIAGLLGLTVQSIYLRSRCL